MASLKWRPRAPAKSEVILWCRFLLPGLAVILVLTIVMVVKIREGERNQIQEKYTTITLNAARSVQYSIGFTPAVTLRQAALLAVQRLATQANETAAASIIPDVEVDFQNVLRYWPLFSQAQFVSSNGAEEVRVQAVWNDTDLLALGPVDSASLAANLTGQEFYDLGMGLPKNSVYIGALNYPGQQAYTGLDDPVEKNNGGDIYLFAPTYAFSGNGSTGTVLSDASDSEEAPLGFVTMRLRMARIVSALKRVMETDNNGAPFILLDDAGRYIATNDNSSVDGATSLSETDSALWEQLNSSVSGEADVKFTSSGGILATIAIDPCEFVEENLGLLTTCYTAGRMYLVMSVGKSQVTSNMTWNLFPLVMAGLAVLLWVCVAVAFTRSSLAAAKLMQHTVSVEQFRSRNKELFLATMCHELRSPLNVIVGCIGLISDLNWPDSARAIWRLLEESTEMLMSIVSDVLDISKIDAGQVDLDPTQCDLIAGIESCVDVHASVALRKGLNVYLTYGPGVPQTAILDFPRLRQVVANLLSNAVKFTAIGIIRMEVRVMPDPLLLPRVADGTSDAQTAELTSSQPASSRKITHRSKKRPHAIHWLLPDAGGLGRSQSSSLHDGGGRANGVIGSDNCGGGSGSGGGANNLEEEGQQEQGEEGRHESTLLAALRAGVTRRSLAAWDWCRRQWRRMLGRLQRAPEAEDPDDFAYLSEAADGKEEDVERGMQRQGSNEAGGSSGNVGNERHNSSAAGSETSSRRSGNSAAAAAGSQVMWLEISVTDTGKGIAEERQARVFDPYVQEDIGSTRQYGGTGLGLAISKRLVDLWGGHITVSSVLTKGSTFTVTVPVELPLERRVVTANDVCALTLSQVAPILEPPVTLGAAEGMCEAHADALRSGAASAGAFLRLYPTYELMIKATALEAVGLSERAALIGHGADGPLSALCIDSDTVMVEDNLPRMLRVLRAAHPPLGLVVFLGSRWAFLLGNECLAGCQVISMPVTAAKVKAAAERIAAKAALAAADASGPSDEASDSAAGGGPLSNNGSSIATPRRRDTRDTSSHLVLQQISSMHVPFDLQERSPGGSMQGGSVHASDTFSSALGGAEGVRSECSVDASRRNTSSSGAEAMEMVVAAAAVAAPPARVRALVVDDGFANRRILQHMLEVRGIVADAAADGNEAVAKELAADPPYDLVFMDLHMPLCDGVEATKRIRERYDKPTRSSSIGSARSGGGGGGGGGGGSGNGGGSAPRKRPFIVMLTASALSSDRDMCLNAGCDVFAAKPMRLETLTSIVGPILEGRQAEQ